jgi:hypothetical protein
LTVTALVVTGVVALPFAVVLLHRRSRAVGVWALAWADAVVAWRGGQSRDAALAFAAWSAWTTGRVRG